MPLVQRNKRKANTNRKENHHATNQADNRTEIEPRSIELSPSVPKIILDDSFVQDYLNEQKKHSNSGENVSIISLNSNDDSIIFVSEYVVSREDAKKDVSHLSDDNLKSSAEQNKSKTSEENGISLNDASIGDFGVSYNESWINRELSELKVNGELTATMDELLKYL